MASISEGMIADLRTRLLDLRNGNKLLGYKHSERGKTQVRIVDELPNVLAEQLAAGMPMYFKSLPEPENELPDECNDEFLMALDGARRLDDDWLKLLDDDEDITSNRALKIERAVRDRVRNQLGLPPAKGGKLISIAEWARMNGIEPNFDLPTHADSNGTDKHIDDEIQTLLLPDELQSKLSGVMDHTRSSLQESGVNILHLAIGFLEWHENQTTDKSLLSPLLLYSVDLQRKALKSKGNYRYAITGSESEPIINITLRERLKRDFGIIIPDYDEADTPESYIAKTASVVADKARWRVRRFATLGLFSFSRLVMYNDLSPDRWGGDEQLPKQGVLAELFGAKEGLALTPEVHDIDDPAVESEVPLLIRDADSSQHATLIDVMRGRNLVIKGPPGTGKSQTIANLIAASLAKGKTVLFVAEKAAALDVVKKRLDDAELGDFCFELHSTKARKLDVLSSLDRRLKLTATFDNGVIDGALGELQALRARLTRHAVTMNLPFSSMEIRETNGHWRKMTVHDIVWAEQKVRAFQPNVTEIDSIIISDAAKTTRFDAERRYDRLTAISRYSNDFGEKFGSARNHPWHLVTRTDIAALAVDDVVGAAASVVNILSNFDSWVTDQLSKLKLDETPLTLRDFEKLAQSLQSVPVPDRTVSDGLIRACLSSPENVASAHELIGKLGERDRHQEHIKSHLTDRLSRLEYASINSTNENAIKHGVSDISIREIGSRAQEALIDAENSRMAHQLVREIFEIFDLKDHPGRFKAVRRFIEVIEVLKKTERSAILYRMSSLNDEMVRPLLVQAAERISSLRSAEVSIRQHVALDASLSALELRRHASTLKSSGLLGKFSADFKSARQIFMSISKNDGKVSETQMAAVLTDVADHLEARQAFDDDLTLRTVCGPRFSGLNTDINGLLAANDFTCMVKATFAGVGEPERAIRRLLIEGDAETLDGIAAYHSDSRLRLLREIVGQSGQDDVDIFVYAESIKAHAASLSDIHTKLSEHGLDFTTTPRIATEVAQSQVRLFEIESEIMSGVLAKFFSGEFCEDGEKSRQILESISVAQKIISINPPNCIIELLRDSPENITAIAGTLQQAGVEINQRVQDIASSLRLFVEKISMRPEDLFDEICSTNTLRDIRDELNSSVNHRSDLMTWVSWLRAIADSRADGLGLILDAFDKAEANYGDLKSAYERVLYRSLMRMAVETYPEIDGSYGLSLSDTRERFKDLDSKVMEMRRQKLVADLASRQIPAGIQSVRKSECTDACLIENEIAKKKKHISIRDLVDRASRAITAMMPCTMMSPSSVAQYLKPEPSFDIVIIDEASQMRPEEAIGALARAHQAVIVGDPQQLPPTAFFARQESDQTENEDDVEKVVAESILDFARGSFRPERELLWHYRSRLGSLIAFSNKYFYDGRLVIFPSPQEENPEHGVRLVTVDGLYQSSVNIPEAHAVANAAVEHMLKFPGKSLGIVSLNQAHRDLIFQEMDRLFVRNPLADRYRAYWDGTLEPFFVKNLENVQGDERDIIMISTVYGPDENGNVFQRFGPINGAAGDRRLNVLFSRAKHGVTIFSSMRPDQIRVGATTPSGTKLLKAYLEFAATGRIESGITPYRDCDSDFEIIVKNRLQSLGFGVVAQVGVAGYRIDLGVTHSTWPHGFLVGIECDGATYHSSLSARDRDRLRQQVLESLGWTIYRIWSTDWFRDPQREMDKLLEFIDSALSKAKFRLAVEPGDVIDLPEVDDNENFAKKSASFVDDNVAESIVTYHNFNSDPCGNEQALSDVMICKNSPKIIPYKEADLQEFNAEIDPGSFFERAYDSVLQAVITRIVDVEGPICEDTLARRVARVHNFQRTGGKILGHVLEIAKNACGFSSEDERTYFWSSNVGPSHWCDFRSPAEGAPPRPIDTIAMPELSALARYVYENSLDGDDPIIMMSRLAGILRLPASTRERLTKAWTSCAGNTEAQVDTSSESSCIT